jgi:hypothetical protein
MFRNSIAVLCATTMLSATALAPTGALASFRHSSGLAGRPVVATGTTSVASTSPITLKAPGGSGVSTSSHPFPHPIVGCVSCTVIKFNPILGGGGATTGGGTTAGGGTTGSAPSPVHRQIGVAFIGGDDGSAAGNGCDVVRMRAPDGRIIEVCNNSLIQ